jgi:APA family basic amino acid/polyamine antiporter
VAVASLLYFRRRPGWQRLRVINFAYPLLPCLFLVVGVWMMLEGILQRPLLSMMTALTLAAGGLLYQQKGKYDRRSGTGTTRDKRPTAGSF